MEIIFYGIILSLKLNSSNASTMPDNTYRDLNCASLIEQMLKIKAPPAPKDFHAFWYSAYSAVQNFRPEVEYKDTHQKVRNWRVIDVYYTSTNDVTIGGWLLLPIGKAPTRGFIVGHGYGGRTAPDFDLPFTDAAIFFPCCRGLGRSRTSSISADPQWHVLHNIGNRDQYILKGCVEDIWIAVSCMEQLFPYLQGKLGFLGVSFTGGIGVLAMACEDRITRAHFNVPTFGHHRLRLREPTWGSGRAIQTFSRKAPRLTLNTLRYYDAANAAEAITMPVHFALALKDPVVTPAGQFAIYNHITRDKQLFVLDEGHADYVRQDEQKKQLLVELDKFFSNL